MRHRGEERIRDRLKNILHLAEDSEGVDPLENPIPVKPGQHYAMGGIETDEHGRTCIHGLYAAGERVCVSMHGANRLGGNSLAELLVFGKRAGQHAAGVDLGEAVIETGQHGEYKTAEFDRPVELGTVAGGRPSATNGRSTATEPDEVLEHAIDAARARVDRLLDRDSDAHHAAVRERVQEVIRLYGTVVFCWKKTPRRYSISSSVNR